MSDTNHRPTPDILEQVTGALRDAPVPAGPRADLTAATVAAIHNRLAGAVPGELARRQRRRRIMRYIGFGSATAAAVALATTAGLLWFGGGSAAAHVQKVLDNAEKARSVKITATLENQGKVTHVRTVYRQGDMVRMETVRDAELPDKPIVVADLKTKKAITLLPATKTARRSILGAQEVQVLTGLMGNFAEMKAQLAGGPDKAVKAAGEETIDGRVTKVYKLTAKAPLSGAWEVWVDPKTDLPVRIRLAPEKDHHSLTLDFADWNKELDAKLFRTDPPEGYKLIGAPKAPAGDRPVPLVDLIRTVLENATKAKSVKAVARMPNAEIPGGVSQFAAYYRQGDVVRMETTLKIPQLPDMPIQQITLADLKTRKMLLLLPQMKAAQRGTCEAQDCQYLAGMMGNFAEMKAQLASGDDKAVKAVGEEMIGGRPTSVYEITVKNAKTPGVCKVWVDPGTELPVRLVIARNGVTLDFEDWNKEFAPKLFSLEVPEGYKLNEVPTPSVPGKKN